MDREPMDEKQQLLSNGWKKLRQQELKVKAERLRVRAERARLKALRANLVDDRREFERAKLLWEEEHRRSRPDDP